MKTKTKNTEKTSTKSAEKKTDGPTIARQDWNGLGMCALIRYCGKKGFGKEKIATIMKKLHLDANPATIAIQMRKGRKDENVPTLVKEHRAEITAIADKIENDVPRKKEKAKTKTEKKPGKKVAKKMKKHVEEDTAEAEAAAEEDAAVDDEVEVEEEEEAA